MVVGSVGSGGLSAIDGRHGIKFCGFLQPFFLPRSANDWVDGHRGTQ